MNHIFETGRLSFRQWNDGDKNEFRLMNADPKVMEHFPAALNNEESDRLLERIRNSMAHDGFGLWAVEKKIDGELIGFIGFDRTTFKSSFTPCIEIGWRLKKAAWGQGFATEGATACLRYGFSVLGFNEVYSFTAVVNKRSERVMQRIGLIRIGKFDHPKVDDGSILKRHVLYKITKEGFDKAAQS